MKLIEETDGKIQLEFFGAPLVIDVETPEDAIRQLVRLVKLLETRVATLERHK